MPGEPWFANLLQFLVVALFLRKTGFHFPHNVPGD